jgi:hypothetical protein
MNTSEAELFIEGNEFLANLILENKKHTVKRSNEYILCAAIWYKNDKQYPHQPKNIKSGYVWCGRRHHNIINLRSTLTGEPTRFETSTQGFITNLDRFVTRVEGNLIAIAANQVTGNIKGDELISEDLY